METFNIIAGLASVASLIISLFAINEVNKIKQKIDIKGDKNIVAGGDVNVRK